MLTNLKRILLTQYIGAIITAFLTVQGLLGLIALSVYLLMWIFDGKQVGVYGGMSRPPLQWRQIGPDLLRAGLELAVAGGFLRWLYFDREPGSGEEQLESLPEEA